MTSQSAADDWNRNNRVGQPVTVLRDSGAITKTVTRTTAFVDAAGQPVVFLRGISGYYLLDRVKAITEAENVGVD
jgi:hypothetical protein